MSINKQGRSTFQKDNDTSKMQTKSNNKEEAKAGKELEEEEEYVDGIGSPNRKTETNRNYSMFSILDEASDIDNVEMNTEMDLGSDNQNLEYAIVGGKSVIVINRGYNKQPMLDKEVPLLAYENTYPDSSLRRDVELTNDPTPTYSPLVPSDIRDDLQETPSNSETSQDDLINSASGSEASTRSNRSRPTFQHGFGQEEVLSTSSSTSRPNADRVSLRPNSQDRNTGTAGRGARGSTPQQGHLNYKAAVNRPKDTRGDSALLEAQRMWAQKGPWEQRNLEVCEKQLEQLRTSLASIETDYCLVTTTHSINVYGGRELERAIIDCVNDKLMTRGENPRSLSTVDEDTFLDINTSNVLWSDDDDLGHTMSLLIVPLIHKIKHSPEYGEVLVQDHNS